MTTPQPAALPERFTKKPVTIEAVQFRNDGSSYALIQWINEGQHAAGRRFASWQNHEIIVPTLEGEHIASPGDWIIKGVKGEFYPCKPDIFEMTYDRAALQSQPAEVSDDADAHFDKIMEQAQVFASAWSLVGGRFDMGNGLEEAEAAKSELRSLVASAILALRPQSESEARRAAQEQLYTERERHTAEVKRLQAEIGRLQSERPQAVPMTPGQMRALVVECGYDHASTQERADFINGVRTGERWHRITAQGAQGGEG